jgi:hypothetical protein
LVLGTYPINRTALNQMTHPPNTHPVLTATGRHSYASDGHRPSVLSFTQKKRTKKAGHLPLNWSTPNRPSELVTRRLTQKVTEENIPFFGGMLKPFNIPTRVYQKHSDHGPPAWQLTYVI